MIFSFTKNCPPGFKTGDQISPPGGYVGVGLQMQVDVRISPAGDVWVTNNWNDLNGATSPDSRPPRPTSTWGGGSGITVIYGVAAPMQPPRMGLVRQP